MKAHDVHIEQNLLARLDRLPITRSVVLIIVLSMAVWVVEAFDIGIVGTVVLSLKGVLHLGPSRVGILAIASTAGIAVGLIPSGRLADIFGRRSVLIWGVALFGIATLLGGIFLNFWVIVLFRFLGGIGEGAVFPLPYIIVSEIIAPKRRGTVISYQNAILSIAYLLPSLVGGWALNTYALNLAWRLPFIIGGVIPLLMLIPITVWLPESPRFLLSKNRTAEVEVFVEKLEREAGVPHDKHLVNEQTLRLLQSSETASGLSSVTLLLKPPYRRRTVVTGLAYMATYFLWYTNLTYTPVILRDEGFSAGAAVTLVGIVIAVGAGGGILGGYLSDRFGRKLIYGIYIAFCVLGAFLLAFHQSRPVLFLGLFVIGWFGAGIFGVAKTYLAEQYPTGLRGFGTSMLELFGRTVPGVGFVYIVPLILAGYGARTVWVIIAILTGLFFLPAALWGRETSRQTIEESGAADNRSSALPSAAKQVQTEGA